MFWRRREQRVPVLTYHAHQITGATYETNDLEAFRTDLRTIRRLGFRIVPALWVAEWLTGSRSRRDLRRSVAITFDDGSDFDFHDLEHPGAGAQRSMLRSLREFCAEAGTEAARHASVTSFVIASPQVRAELDAACLVGRGWMSDDWWPVAQASGLVAIGNHSWDHNHPEASRTCQREQRKGAFDAIETEAECDAEVADAARYIAHRIGRWPVLFAYPGGTASHYLRECYLPEHGARHGTLAAFAADGGYVTRESSRWFVPRFVCGAHWRDPSGLEEILRGAR